MSERKQHVWTGREIKELERLVTLGVSFREAGSVFGLSKGAIAGQVRRIKLRKARQG